MTSHPARVTALPYWVYHESGNRTAGLTAEASNASYFITNGSDNDFYFEINGDAITQVFFKDEQLVIDGNDLVMKYWNEEQPIRYSKE